MTDPLVHIGYPKTGTTWLQEFVFPSSRLGLAMALPVSELDRWMVFPHGFDFQAMACRKRIEGSLIALARKGLVPVLSCERLSGLPHAGGWNSKEIADRVFQTLPEARILISIREQKSMLLSIYHQYIRAGGQCSLRDYISPAVRGPGKLPLFNLRHFEYDRLIAYYVSRFGKHRVLILPYEMLDREPLAYLERLLQFAGASQAPGALHAMPWQSKVNERWPPGILEIQRLLNILLIRKTMNPWVLSPSRSAEKMWKRCIPWLRGLIPESLNRRVSASQKKWVDQQVGDCFRESNRRTADLLGQDLAQLGYAA